MDDATIAALSTPPGKGGIAVIRISGPDTLERLGSIIESFPQPLIPRRAYHQYVIKAEKRIEECVFVFYKGPHSYTGEDLAEISIHSNPFLIEEVLNLIYQANIRAALPGEFTFRAFKNGKMDLIQAETVNELINANSRVYANMKFGSLEGQLSRLVAKIREYLIDMGSRVETKLEFEEDQYLDRIDFSEGLHEIISEIKQVLSHSRFNDLLDKGLNVVLVGRFNVGKSSLFNQVLMEERSITSPIPGTTRDFIEQKIYIGGFPIVLVDVAGMNKDSRDTIEKKGIQRSYEKIKNSDAVIFMVDASQQLDKTDYEIQKKIENKDKLVVVNKVDIGNPEVLSQIHGHFKGDRVVEISVKDQINLGSITGYLKKLVTDVQNQNQTYTINRRQQSHLRRLRDCLQKILCGGRKGAAEIEIVAEEIKGALQIIADLTGEITADDILKRIFANFCVGK